MTNHLAQTSSKERNLFSLIIETIRGKEEPLINYFFLLPVTKHLTRHNLREKEFACFDLRELTQSPVVRKAGVESMAGTCSWDSSCLEEPNTREKRMLAVHWLSPFSLYIQYGTPPSSAIFSGIGRKPMHHISVTGACRTLSCHHQTLVSAYRRHGFSWKRSSYLGPFSEKLPHTRVIV